jgi:peptidoglycan/LPS O-acetylase OafA/YrhL
MSSAQLSPRASRVLLAVTEVSAPKEPSATPSRAPARRRASGYWPGLDGMRALAVAAVVAYHLDPGLLPAGFFGVDIFFVISGYLITSLLAAEWARRGRVDLKAFWLRRVKRLYPAVVALLVVVVVIGAALVPDALSSARWTIAAALVYLTNWWFIFHHVPYFQAVGRPPLLVHFWSLAIEEQYYLLWPPVLAFLLLRWRRPGRVAVLAVVGALASTLAMALLYHPGASINRVYFGSDTHCQGLLLGSALGLLVPPSRMRKGLKPLARWVLDGVGIAALIGLIALMVVLNQAMTVTWRGGFGLVVLLAGAAVVVAAHPASRLAKALSWAPLRWLGTRSYSVYLWHWPILDLTRPYQDLPFSGAPLLLLRLTLIAVASELSYRLVEQPWRTGRAQAAVRSLLARRPMHRRLGALSASGALATLVALVVTAPTTSPSLFPFHATATRAATRAIAPLHRPGLTSSAPQHGRMGRAGVSGSSTSSSEPLLRTHPQGPDSLEAGAGRRPVAAPGLSQRSRHAGANKAPATTGASPPTAGPPGLLHAPPGRPVLAVGDSVMLAASQDLQDAFGPSITVDAEVGRQVSQGLVRLAAYRAAGRLRDLRAVVVDLGSNGPFIPQQLHQLESITKGVPEVVLVNVRVPREWQSITNQTIASGVATDRSLRLADWYQASASPSLLWPDEIHPNPAGQVVYSNLVVRAVDQGP